MLHNNLLATLITFIIAIAWLRFIDFFAHQGFISGKISRKIIHIGTGPVFILCWLFFDDAILGRYLAALVPFATTIQFALVGFGLWKDQAAVDAMTRTGDRKEILRGPLIYGIAFVLITILFWKASIVGIVALMILCGGDGFADVIGKNVPSGPLPWSKLKTWAGSLAMLAGSFLLSYGVLAIFTSANIFMIDWQNFLPKLALVCFVCTIVESFPIRDFDNLTVPITAILLGTLLF
jgi:phytol kinase